MEEACIQWLNLVRSTERCAVARAVMAPFHFLQSILCHSLALESDARLLGLSLPTGREPCTFALEFYKILFQFERAIAFDASLGRLHQTFDARLAYHVSAFAHY